ncbi:MAG TPA: prepilin-type N-terminal cleavage/methylation domain-containing protein [Candidatus Woesebacteria bacterium]|nr:prepilin-type N-terminal cleavage/methylation domain-containing protein [Candidatus Woesebacteria bacterium]
MKKIKNNLGFTLVELLVVISIMGILTVISVASFTSAQIKARDSQRKSDLDQTAKALMLYYGDTGTFPAEGDFKFGYEEDNGFKIGETIYMRKTPKDPKDSSDYVYVYKTDGKSFNLFANLENKKDSQCNGSYAITGVGSTFCYGVSSPNSLVKSWLE